MDGWMDVYACMRVCMYLSKYVYFSFRCPSTPEGIYSRVVSSFHVLNFLLLRLMVYLDLDL